MLFYYRCLKWEGSKSRFVQIIGRTISW